VASVVKQAPFTTISHVLRDCPYLETKRAAAVRQAATIAEQLGIATSRAKHPTHGRRLPSKAEARLRHGTVISHGGTAS
jgi:hypothetical protein